MTPEIRPDLHARFLAIYQRAIAREQAEWDAIIRGRPRDRSRLTRTKGIAMKTRLPDRVKSTGAFLEGWE